VRYLAAELGEKRIRVHAISPGPLKTRAASGIARFDELMERAAMTELVTIEEIGALSAFLASDAAAGQTGSVSYVDGGFHVVS
jgi:enoyl-[acyl-carrier protein] reductase I